MKGITATRESIFICFFFNTLLYMNHIEADIPIFSVLHSVKLAIPSTVPIWNQQGSR